MCLELTYIITLICGHHPWEVANEGSVCEQLKRNVECLGWKVGQGELAALAELECLDGQVPNCEWGLVTALVWIRLPFIGWSFSLHCDGVWRCGRWELIPFRQAHEDEAHRIEVGHQRDCSLSNHLKARKTVVTRIWRYLHLILDFSASETLRNTFLLFSTHSLWC